MAELDLSWLNYDSTDSDSDGYVPPIDVHGFYSHAHRFSSSSLFGLLQAPPDGCTSCIDEPEPPPLAPPLTTVESSSDDTSAPDASPVRCRLGPCDQDIHDVSIKGIKNHISAAHAEVHNCPQRNVYSGTGKVACFWDAGGKTCGKAVTINGLAKHLASAHMGIMRKNCQYCGKSLARIDSLIRHQRRDCKAISEDARTMLEIRCE